MTSRAGPRPFTGRAGPKKVGPFPSLIYMWMYVYDEDIAISSVENLHTLLIATALPFSSVHITPFHNSLFKTTTWYFLAFYFD